MKLRHTQSTPKASTPRRWVPSRLIEIDAWIDTGLWRFFHSLSSYWENVTIFFRRFRARGFKRALVEVACEGLTLGVAGLILMLVLAQPAMRLTLNGLPLDTDYSVLFLDRHGNEIGRRGVLRADSIPIDEMPDPFIKAVLATEDRRFFEHRGIDVFGLVRAMNENARAGGVVQGGSTLTQQLAKNIFLSNERTIDRKINEAFLSLWLEANLSKREILGMYLDRAYMGGGTFGAVGAARFYFDKDLREISLAEAAMLAGLFKAPANYAPHINLPAARARANEVLSNMVQAGFMTEGQVVAARRQPATAVDRSTITSPDYFLDFAFAEVQRIAEKIPHRNFIARTSFDAGLQQLADESVEYHLRQFGKPYAVEEAAMVVLDDEGGVRAVVGGRDYGLSQFNRATKALRQPGSSFKGYVYAAAMEAGYKPEDVISDGPVTVAGWSPQNYGRSYVGRVTLATALAKSINTVAVRLSQKIGMAKVTALARAMGVESPLRGDKTMALGTSEVTIMDQATGYAVFPAGGLEARRHAILALSDTNGETLWDAAGDLPPRRRVLSEQATKSMNEMLVQIPVNGTARKAALTRTRAAGKTGTTQGYRDAWFVGFTGNFTAAVWFGNDSFSPTKELTGGSLPAQTWQRFMEGAHQGIELKPIPYLDDPLPAATDPKVAAGAEGAAPLPVRPLSLTNATQKVLIGISDLFQTAPPLGPEKIAANRPGETAVAPQ